MKTEVTCHAIECENCENDTCTCGWITLEHLDGREFVCENYTVKTRKIDDQHVRVRKK
jgi:hypothetical protein